jgi:acyl-CoA reductase-like NAD-dependent aldehyde dehydrogenase
MGPLIRESQRTSVEGYVDRAIAAGGSVVAGGGRPDLATGYYMNPVLVAGVSNTSEIAQSELFGPVGIVIPFDTVGDRR